MNIFRTKRDSRATLTAEQYQVCFLKGIEPPGSGRWLHHKAKGRYVCVNCGQELFKSDTKFDSQTGWPSFWDPSSQANVKIEDDYSLGMLRAEVLCSSCGAHLGHVFSDGPKPTGRRYCINSLALDFQEEKNSN